MALTNDLLSNLSSPSKVVSLLGSIIALGFMYIFLKAISNVYFHPLSKFPGNPWYSISPLAQALDMINGTYTRTIKAQHDRYGDVIRIGTNAISFINPTAPRDIYIRPGKEELPKDPITFRAPMNGEMSIIQIPDKKEHAQHRALLQNSFSDKSLREQEPLIMKYVHLLIRRLHEHCRDGPLDMSKIYNFVTFDIITDLSYGEPLGCLEDFEPHPWLTWTFKSIKSGVFLGVGRRFPIFGKYLVQLMVPDIVKLMEQSLAMFKFTEKVSLRRIRAKTDRRDFVSAVMENDHDVHLNENQLVSMFNLLVIAGSETTATSLTGTTSLLVENRDILDKVTKEVRDAFEKEEEITILAVSSLKYLNAVIQESLRLFPPAPGGNTRKTMQDEEICGHVVPKGTSVFYHQISAYHSTLNWKDPEKFAPERWLGDERYANDNRASLRPFSSGPRNCIGINLANTEMRLVLAHLLWNFDLGMPTWEGRYINGNKIYGLWERGPLKVEMIPVQRGKAN